MTKEIKLLERVCVCGCGARFRTSRPHDLYSSMACEALHRGEHPKQLERRRANDLRELRSEPHLPSNSPTIIDPKPPLPPGTWLTNQQLALRLDTHSAMITRLVRSGVLTPLECSDGSKRFELAETIRLVRAYNNSQPRLKKLLTKFFGSQ